jgi:hypothetical protein
MKTTLPSLRLAATMAAAAALLSACIPSLQPFYTEADLVAESPLAGAWQLANDDNKEVWTFEQTGTGAFSLSIVQQEKDKAEKTGKLSAHLFRLEGKLFLDLIPSDCDFADDQIELVSMATFPGHLLARVYELDATKVRLAFFDWDWLQKHLEANPQALAHHRDGDRIILTAAPADLQRFVLAHLGDDELFEKGDGDEGLLTRVPEPAEPTPKP